MSCPPKTLRELLKSGDLNLRPKDEFLAAEHTETAAITHFLEETRSEALGTLRRPGRPTKMAMKRETEVRSLRLEKNLWIKLEIESEEAGCSVNRFIEEAICQRIKYYINKDLISTFIALDNWHSVQPIMQRDKPITFDAPTEERVAA